MSTVVSDVQPEKAADPMVSRLSERDTEASETQFWNALLWISVIDSKEDTSSRTPQFRKALPSIFVTVAGNETDVNAEQPEHMEAGMDGTGASIEREEMAVSLKALGLTPTTV